MRTGAGNQEGWRAAKRSRERPAILRRRSPPEAGLAEGGRLLCSRRHVPGRRGGARACHDGTPNPFASACGPSLLTRKARTSICRTTKTEPSHLQCERTPAAPIHSRCAIKRRNTYFRQSYTAAAADQRHISVAQAEGSVRQRDRDREGAAGRRHQALHCIAKFVQLAFAERRAGTD